jgi:hypothetical protein
MSESAKVDELINSIKGLTVLELAELVKSLEKEFGISAAAPRLRRRLSLLWSSNPSALIRSTLSKPSESSLASA